MVLAAVARGKASSFLSGTGTRMPREDLITSAIFGPLPYLPDPARALDALLGAPSDGSLWAGATSLRMDFWPRIMGNEPDIVIEARTDRLLARVLVEVKWGAGLQTAQIDRYLDALSAAGRPANVTILLGAEDHHDTGARGDGRGATPRTWRDAARGLRDLIRTDGSRRSPEALWARDVHLFLQRDMRGRIFGDFRHLGLEGPAPDTFDWTFRSPRRAPFRALEAVEVLPRQFTAWEPGNA